MANDAGQSGKANGRKSGMNIDTALVRELAELLNETGLTEIEVEDDDLSHAAFVNYQLHHGADYCPRSGPGSATPLLAGES